MVDYMTHQALVYQAACRGHFRFEERRKFLNDLNIHIYVYPGVRRALCEEEWSEFYLGFLGKIPDILMNYEFRGPSFLSYLNRLLDWHLKSYYKRCERYRQECWVHERESFLSGSLSSGCSEGCDCGWSLREKIECVFTQSGIPAHRREALRQRLLILVLKNAAVLEESDFLTAFPLLGPDREEAVRMRLSLLDTLEEKRKRRDELSLKRNESYYRLALAFKKKDEAVSDKIREELDGKILLYRRRLRRMEEQIRRVPMVPCNGDIAGLLGMPKGSVDSGLYYLRLYLRELKKKDLCCLEDLAGVRG